MRKIRPESELEPEKKIGSTCCFFSFVFTFFFIDSKDVLVFTIMQMSVQMRRHFRFVFWRPPRRAVRFFFNFVVVVEHDRRMDIVRVACFFFK